MAIQNTAKIQKLKSLLQEIAENGQHQYVQNQYKQQQDTLFSFAWFVHLVPAKLREEEIYYLQNAINKFCQKHKDLDSIDSNELAILYATMSIVESLIQNEKRSETTRSRLQNVMDDIRDKLPPESARTTMKQRAHAAAVERALKGKYPKAFKKEIEKISIQPRPNSKGKNKAPSVMS